MAPDRFLRSATDPRAGRYSAQVTVKPGDNPLRPFCPSCGERSEALGMTRRDGGAIDETVKSGTQFYAFSVRLAPGWKNPTPARDVARPTCGGDFTWGIVLQLHGPDDYSASPAFALQTWDSLNKGDKFTVSLNAGSLGADPNTGRKSFGLKKGGLAVGSWIDWIFQVRWADDATGLVNAWRRDEGQSGFAQVLAKKDVATLQRRGGSRGLAHYWKTGFYRPADCHLTNRLWIEGPARGTSFDAVRKALWGR